MDANQQILSWGITHHRFMPHCLLGLGANLGDRQLQLDRALAEFARDPRVRVQAVSSYLSTEPVGGPAGQDAFLNAAAILETDYEPLEIWQQMRRVESVLGRQRGERWEARTIDLDLLLYDEHEWASPELIVPHPWMVARRFVLQPAAEIAANWKHPILHWSLDRLWQHAQHASPRFALAGSLDRSLGPVIAQRTSASWVRDPARDSASSATSNLHSRLPAARQALAEAGWDDPQCLTVLLSEFWWDEIDSRAAVAPDAAERERASEPFTHISQPAPAKLVFIGAASDPASTADQRWTGGHSASPSGVRARELLDRLVERGESVGVIVPSVDPADVVREVAGAITAMETI